MFSHTSPLYNKDLEKEKLPLIIQGGMGVGVSGWRLAKAVSSLGQMGVVSGTGINSVFTRKLQDGDPDGDLLRAMASFPDKIFSLEVRELYFEPKRRPLSKYYKRCVLPCIESPLFLQRLNVLASFVEVFLAKENHSGIVGINFLEKLQTTNLPGIYGAMLASVDYVLMGAGIPREIPGVLDKFSQQLAASIKISVQGANSQDDFRVNFDPHRAFPMFCGKKLRRPRFLAIVSSDTLATHLARKSTGSVDGFVIEGITAGGHNAPPRGPLHLSEQGEPIYGLKDVANLEVVKELGLPFWLAGSFASLSAIKKALALGAAGVQLGTAFAFCEESGLSEALRKSVIAKCCAKSSKAAAVFTDPFASPTGFPFKVLPLENTLSDVALYEARPRKCDLGYLRQAVKQKDGTIVYRCPAEPVKDFLRKGGKVEETLNRKCLCNALMANIGLGQIQEAGYEELPLLTAGDDLSCLTHFIRRGGSTYSVKDVIANLT